METFNDGKHEYIVGDTSNIKFTPEEKQTWNKYCKRQWLSFAGGMLIIGASAGMAINSCHKYNDSTPKDAKIVKEYNALIANINAEQSKLRDSSFYGLQVLAMPTDEAFTERLKDAEKMRRDAQDSILSGLKRDLETIAQNSEYSQLVEEDKRLKHKMQHGVIGAALLGLVGYVMAGPLCSRYARKKYGLAKK